MTRSAAKPFPSMTTAAAKIMQRRIQMFVHSYLYYALSTSIVSDHQFDAWARELVMLHKNHPKPVGFHDEDFADWDGSTGYHLPQYPWVVDHGQLLLRLHENPQLRAGHAQPAPAAPVLGQIALF